MTKLNYAQQIKHPEWQKKRLEVLEANGFECPNCGAKDEELHVHHPFYKRGAMIWQYEVDELECLCHKCHKDGHALDEKIKREMSYGNHNKAALLGWLKGNARDNNSTVEEIEEAYGLLQSYGLNSERVAMGIVEHGCPNNSFDLCDLSRVINKFVNDNINMFFELAISHHANVRQKFAAKNESL